MTLKSIDIYNTIALVFNLFRDHSGVHRVIPLTQTEQNIFNKSIVCMATCEDLTQEINSGGQEGAECLAPCPRIGIQSS